VWEWSYGIWPLLMAAVFAVVVWDGVEFERALSQDTGVNTAPATVTGVQACGEGLSRGRACTDTVVIRFRRTTGREVTTETDRVSWEPVPRVGDVIAVRYSDRDPAYFVRDARWGSPVRDVVLPAVLAVLLVGWGVAVLTRLPQRWQRWNTARRSQQ